MLEVGWTSPRRPTILHFPPLDNPHVGSALHDRPCGGIAGRDRSRRGSALHGLRSMHSSETPGAPALAWRSSREPERPWPPPIDAAGCALETAVVETRRLPCPSERVLRTSSLTHRTGAPLTRYPPPWGICPLLRGIPPASGSLGLPRAFLEHRLAVTRHGTSELDLGDLPRLSEVEHREVEVLAAGNGRRQHNRPIQRGRVAACPRQRRLRRREVRVVGVEDLISGALGRAPPPRIPRTGTSSPTVGDCGRVAAAYAGCD